jgi:hypothetical protein
MARDRNTYAKRQRESDKRRKAEEKRARRLKRKDDIKVSAVPDNGDQAPTEQ